MSAAAFEYKALVPKVRKALRSAFQVKQLRTQEGYRGRVHVKVVAPNFNGLSEKRKQELVWEVLEAALGPDAMGVSLVVPYGTDELP